MHIKRRIYVPFKYDNHTNIYTTEQFRNGRKYSNSLSYDSNIDKSKENKFTKIAESFNFKNNDSKSNIRLVIESAIQLGLTAALCYPARKIIDNMPFITTDGYTKMKLKDYEQGGVIWSSFVALHPFGGARH